MKLPISQNEARALLSCRRFKGRTAEALFMYLTGEVKTRATAARAAGIDRSLVTRALKQLGIQPTTCPHCGQLINP